MATIPDKLNELNDYIILANEILSKRRSKEEYEYEMYPIRVKLKAIRACAIFFEQKFNTFEDVFDNVLEACVDTEMSIEDTHYEIGKYLLAFNECESIGWENIPDLSDEVEETDN